MRKPIIVAFLLLVVFGATAPLYVEPVKAAWLENWAYRKKHDLVGSAGAGVDYQMMFIVRRSTGTDTDNIVYVGTKCNADFSDIRFTDISGNVFPYAITYRTTDEAWFWVKCNTITLDANRSIYIYYGNPTATSQSNLDDTFIFAEPWDNETGFNPRWTIEQGTWGTNFVIEPSLRRLKILSSPTIGQGLVRSTSTSLPFPSSYRVESYLAQQYETVYDNYAFEFGAYLAATTNKYSRCDWSIHHASFSDSGVAFDSYYAYTSGSSYYFTFRIGVGHNEDCEGNLGGGSGYYTSKWVIRRNSTNYFLMYRAGSLVYSEFNTETPNRIYFRYTQNVLSDAYYAYFYAFKIRKYVEPEPSNGDWYPEETSTGLACHINVYQSPSWLPNGVFALDNNSHVMPYSATITAGTHNLDIIDEKITLNATHIYNFHCWKKGTEVYSYEKSCSFTIDLGETFDFYATYQAYQINVSTTPTGINALFEADGWELTAPVTIYRGPGLHTFYIRTTTAIYNSTHRAAFMGWYVNDIFISPSETINVYLAYDSTVKIAYRIEEIPAPPPTYLHAQIVVLGEVKPGTTKDFTINVQFDLNTISITKVEFQTYGSWFTIKSSLPLLASRGLERIGVALIEATVNVPTNVLGQITVPFTVTAETPDKTTLTTSSYVTMTITGQVTPSEGITITEPTQFYEILKRILGDPLILLLLIILTAILGYYSLKKPR